MLLFSIIVLSFTNKPFAFDGGIINNANIAINANSEPPEITATNASGCSGTVIYQWQQSFDNSNFVDVPNATAVSYKPVLLLNTTHFRRKAMCSGGDTAYTSNVATITIIQTAP